MLIQGFYQIENLNHTDGKINCRIVLNQSHEVYKGHFPGQPVVPGVVQLQIMKEIMEEGAQKKLFLKQITSTKYLQPIDPLVFPELEIQIEFNEIEENTFKIKALIQAKENTFTKIRALVAARN